MRVATPLLTAVLSFPLVGTALANTYGSVEPIANPAVIDTRLLRDQALAVREAFAERLLQCGIVVQVIDALSSTGAVNTINGLNTHFEVGAGGFAGRTNPAYVYTVIDSGPNAASMDDIEVLTEDKRGQAYLARIPAKSHKALRGIRDFHLGVTRAVLQQLERGQAIQFQCR